MKAWRTPAGGIAVLLSIFSSITQAGASPYYSPNINSPPTPRLFWGDTHIHTRLSPDAYLLGGSLEPQDAYRFARGETVYSNTRQPVNIGVPLDFVVLTDHAEFLGVFPLLEERDQLFTSTPLGKRWLELFDLGEQQKIFGEFISSLWGRVTLNYPNRVKHEIWKGVTRAADTANDPGNFTAFIGFEWTSLPDGDNLHRNVIFRDGSDKTEQVSPLSSLSNPDPESLWDYMENYESLTKGQVLAIPHNGNGGNGLMFSDKSFGGDLIDAEYASARARWEPLYEVTQIKGDGEAHPYLSPEDAFSNYETWDYGNLKNDPNPKEPWMLKHEYARSALKLGIGLQTSLGANPFHFGMIGSSDSHTGLAAIEESNFWGKFGSDEPSPGRVNAHLNHLKVRDYAASGYAAVWARENTREALFDAMRRRETYATTGPRIKVRFFAGWQFEPIDVHRSEFVQLAFSRGVPMGAQLLPGPVGEKPKFLIFASKGPDGANLDRVQIIKGWINRDGDTREKVYDVALSDDRQLDPSTGHAPPLASTVNISNATYTNSVGDVQLSTVWTDADFDSAQNAFYYVRVLEIATPRWTTYDAAFFGRPPPDDVPAIQQERAYTSPIWYVSTNGPTDGAVVSSAITNQ